jgi:hypothetical protein
MCDVERQLSSTSDSSQGALQELIGRTKRVLSQKQKDKNKLYALHAPEVECLAKGTQALALPVQYPDLHVSLVRDHRRSKRPLSLRRGVSIPQCRRCNNLQVPMTIHAVLCGAGHNLRMILTKLRLYCALVLLALLNRSAALPFAT